MGGMRPDVFRLRRAVHEALDAVLRCPDPETAATALALSLAIWTRSMGRRPEQAQALLREACDLAEAA